MFKVLFRTVIYQGLEPVAAHVVIAEFDTRDAADIACARVAELDAREQGVTRTQAMKLYYSYE